MMMGSRSTLLFVVLLSVICFIRAQEKFRFANYYGDHMVLQRSPSASIVWGYVPNCQTSVTLTMASFKTLATLERIMGKTYCSWKAQLPATPEGGPYVITAKTTTPDGILTISIKDVLFGDVWLCGGQSNMVFELISVFNSSEEIKAAANYSNIRLMQVDRVGSNVTTEEPPLVEGQAPWSVASPANVGSFSAVCWLYGRNIYDTYSVPIGLISSNWGGTEIQLWSSSEALQKCPTTANSKSSQSTILKQRRAAPKPTTPSALWNSMIYPFLKMTICGAIWYQGEANSHSIEDAEQYKCLFSSMIADWREKWHFNSDQQTKENFPFGFVQLAADGEDNKTQGFFPELRWSQTADFGYVPNSKLENVFMAVAMDLGDPQSPHGSIHPRDKQDVAIRLAAAGRAVAYGDSNIYYNGPLPYHITSYHTSTGILGQVFFKNVVGSMYYVNQYGFELACTHSSGTKEETWIEGRVDRITGNSVVYIIFPKCPDGYKDILCIRYAWRQNPCPFKKCSIYSGSDYKFPAPPFVFTEDE